MLAANDQQNLLVKSVVGLVPGADRECLKFGLLLDSRELMRMMLHPQNPQHQILTEATESDPDAITSSFIVDRFGIESIAMTNSTRDYLEELSKQERGISSSAGSFARLNGDLYDMLEVAVHKALQRSEMSPEHIVWHFHINPMPHSIELSPVRTALFKNGIGCAVQSILIPQGCSAILAAFDLAQSVLRANSETNGHVIITALSDMLKHSHQRMPSSRSMEDIDHWLWGAIFGEAVGAMVVGLENANKCNNGWTIEHQREAIAEYEPRLTWNWNSIDQQVDIFVKAREVKRTYIKNITDHARLVLENCQGVENLDYLCLHESNPNIVKMVAKSVGVPLEKVPILSHKFGSLAAVSAFTLLDAAINRPKCSLVGRKRIGMALIGESVGVVRVGSFVLRPPDHLESCLADRV